MSSLTHRKSPFSSSTQQPLVPRPDCPSFQPKPLAKHDKDKCSRLRRPLPHRIRGRTWHICSWVMPSINTCTPSTYSFERKTPHVILPHTRVLKVTRVPIKTSLGGGLHEAQLDQEHANTTKPSARINRLMQPQGSTERVTARSNWAPKQARLKTTWSTQTR